MAKYLLTLLLLFISPYYQALDPVLEERDEVPSYECDDRWYWTT